MSKTIELKPCPFCGGAPQMVERDHGAWVHCYHCGGSSDGSDAVTGAAAAWNRRHTDAAPSENMLLEEALSAAVDYIEAQMGDTEERQRQAWKAYRRAMDRLRALRGDE